MAGDWPLEEVAKAVGGSYCRLQMPLKLALAVRGTVAGRRLGAQKGGIPCFGRASHAQHNGVECPVVSYGLCVCGHVGAGP